MTGVNTYGHRWWDGYTQAIDYDTDCTLMVSVDGRDYYESDGVLMIDPAMDGAEAHTYKAYTVADKDGAALRSPIATLTVTARDPNVTDWSAARWERVEEDEELDALAGHYLLFSSNTLHVMSATQAKNGFMEDAGFTIVNDKGEITELPVEAAVVTFEPVDNSKYRLMVSDIYGSYRGSWSVADGNKMSLSQSTYTCGGADDGWRGTLHLHLRRRQDADVQQVAAAIHKLCQQYEPGDTGVSLPLRGLQYRDRSGGVAGRDSVGGWRGWRQPDSARGHSGLRPQRSPD